MGWSKWLHVFVTTVLCLLVSHFLSESCLHVLSSPSQHKHPFIRHSRYKHTWSQYVAHKQRAARCVPCGICLSAEDCKPTPKANSNWTRYITSWASDGFWAVSWPQAAPSVERRSTFRCFVSVAVVSCLVHIPFQKYVLRTNYLCVAGVCVVFREVDILDTAPPTE